MGQRIGEMAAATGLTVRTLHYYEEIGLLVPSGRSERGHRLYDESDHERLRRIGMLRRLGLALEDVARVLDDPSMSLKDVMTRHLDELERRLDATVTIRNRISRLIAADLNGDRPLTDDLAAVLEEMEMLNLVQRRITLLVYADIEAIFAYLERVFLLGPGTLQRNDEGEVVHGELQAGDGVIWLHPESTDHVLASPRTLGAVTASVAIIVDDTDAHHRHALTQGADIVYAPVDQPYGYREYSARDPEGGFWSFMQPLG